jgi:hypothetical protein
VEGLAQLAAELDLVNSSPRNFYVAMSLRGWRSGDPKAVEHLGKIAGNAYFKPDAAEALSRIHTRDAVPHLVELLDSKDIAVRRSAIHGLSLFVAGVPILTAERTINMVYLGEHEKSEFYDNGIAPYVSVTPVGIPAGPVDQYVTAWRLWWLRTKPRMLLNRHDAQ